MVHPHYNVIFNMDEWELQEQITKKAGIISTEKIYNFVSIWLIAVLSVSYELI